MSGGVDSSVAAALLRQRGHEVVGATMKLWGGESDSGCCSVSDVDDARRVAQQLDIDHHVFNFAEDFDANVVTPYVEAHAAGRTPNPCIECNRHLKFDRFLGRAEQLGFDAVATGHHARIVRDADGYLRVARAADAAKDQSYVLHMLGAEQLARTVLPIGELTKAAVREIAAGLGLTTAQKPDSQDVCFITSTAGRAAFLSARIPMHPGRVVDAETGQQLGAVDAVELVTVGQRRGIGASGERRYVVSVDVATSTVAVGLPGALLTDRVEVRDLSWSGEPVDLGGAVLVQTSAHGEAFAATFVGDAVAFDEPRRRVAPGQTVVLYRDDLVLGGGIAA